MRCRVIATKAEQQRIRPVDGGRLLLTATHLIIKGMAAGQSRAMLDGIARRARVSDGLCAGDHGGLGVELFAKGMVAAFLEAVDDDGVEAQGEQEGKDDDADNYTGDGAVIQLLLFIVVVVVSSDQGEGAGSNGGGGAADVREGVPWAKMSQTAGQAEHFTDSDGRG